MPLIISKNTMRYDADQAEAQKRYETSADIGVTNSQPYSFDPPFLFSVDDKCHTCYAELAYTMPGESTGQAGIHFILKGESLEGMEELPMIGVKNARGGSSGFLAATIGSVEPLTRVHLEIHSLSGNFTIPSGSKFNMSVRANDSALLVHPVSGPAPVLQTQYYMLAFGSHWNMGYGNGDHVTKFEARIAEINNALPSGEPQWVLSSPNTPEKIAAVADHIHDRVVALRAHPNNVTDSNNHTSLSSAVSIDGAWAGDNFRTFDGSNLYSSGTVHINLTKVGNGDYWQWGDGTTIAITDPRWGYTGANATTSNAIMFNYGGAWGSQTQSADVGNLETQNVDQIRTFAVYERQV